MSTPATSSSSLLQFVLARAHQRYLPLLGRRFPSGNDVPLPVSDVTVNSGAVLILRDVLEMDSVRTGMMFGRRMATHLSVTHITAGGYDGQTPLFAVNADYALGVTDALRQVDASIDWTGQWLTVPGDAFADRRQQAAWAELAQREGLLSLHYPLLIIGWREGTLVARSIITTGDQEEELAVRTVLLTPEVQ